MASPTSPIAASGALSTFTIATNGKAVDSTIQVAAIDTWTAFGAAPRARIAVFDGDPAIGDFPISNNTAFAPGASIAIALGYDGKNETVFIGTITAQQIAIDENGPSRLIVEAAAKDVTMWSGSMPPPVLSVVYGNSILNFKGTTLSGGQAKADGEVKFQGSSLAVPGAAMELGGLGDRFNGTALIVGVHQLVRDGVWMTTANFGAPPTPKTLELSTPGGGWTVATDTIAAPDPGWSPL